MTGPSVLIAALSGRAAAMAARRAGFTPYVADLFADLDTTRIAAGVRRVPGDTSSGFADRELLDALASLAATMAEPPIGVVYGAGFENRPDLLRRIAARWPLLGNTPETVATVKHPDRFAEALARLGIPHPSIARPNGGPPPPGWLSKRMGGAGGGHIGLASDLAPGEQRVACGENARGQAQDAAARSLPPGGAEAAGAGGVYWQRQVEGRPISVLFLSGAAGARVIGFSEQWTAPAPGLPFRFGGAVTPANISACLAAELGAAVRKLAPVLGLSGLNSADFLVGRAGWQLLEINPRLGATLDIFDGPGSGLFAAHIMAVRGGAMTPAIPIPGAQALQLVYAPAPIPYVPSLDWPSWSRDTPQAGEVISGQAPCCTVLASAPTACEALRLCRKRAGEILTLMGVEQCRKPL
jgi:predicted ATP-grasp superfamily ATP-dependent carboligase